MPYNFKIAAEVLSEADKNRILCIYLNTDNTTGVNWAKATADFGCASVDSMRVMLRTALKKVENAGGKEEADGTPVKATSPAASRKRKAAGATDGDADGALSSPTAGKGKRGRPVKKAKNVEAGYDDENAEDEGVKKQENGDHIKSEEDETMGDGMFE